MEIVFSSQALKDAEFWKKSGNEEVQTKIAAFLESIKQTPFSGIGKPEPLKGNLSGFWSRRITKEDRVVYTVVYKVQESFISVLSLKGHYEKL